MPRYRSSASSPAGLPGSWWPTKRAAAPGPIRCGGRPRRELSLAKRAGDEVVRAAIARLPLPTRDHHLRRAGLRRIGVEAVALFIAFALAELIGGGLAVRVPLAATGQMIRPDAI